MTNVSSYYYNIIQTRSNVNNDEHYTLGEKQIINEQSFMGWEHFIRGRITSVVHLSIKHYYREEKNWENDLLLLHGIELSLKK